MRSRWSNGDVLVDVFFFNAACRQWLTNEMFVLGRASGTVQWPEGRSVNWTLPTNEALLVCRIGCDTFCYATARHRAARHGTAWHCTSTHSHRMRCPMRCVALRCRAAPCGTVSGANEPLESDAGSRTIYLRRRKTFKVARSRPDAVRRRAVTSICFAEAKCRRRRHLVSVAAE